MMFSAHSNYLMNRMESTKTVFVVPAFEVDKGTDIPLDKRSLNNLAKLNKTRQIRKQMK